MLAQARLRLLSNCTARDKGKLQRLQDPLSGAWLTPTSCEVLGLTFNTKEFKYLLRWRLGMPLIQNGPNIEACGKCGEVLDVYGDHAVTCKRNNFHTRRQLVVEALARVLTSADIPGK